MNDKIGWHSRIEYGLTGEKVQVLKDHGDDFKVVENRGVKFLVRKEELSENPIYDNKKEEVKIHTPTVKRRTKGI